jgi:transposase
LLEQARTSIASLHDDTMAELVRDQVRQLREANARQERLETLLSDAYRQLPQPNHLDTIPGYGTVTAAILTAFILDIDRFATPGQLVAYFGALPIEVSSGVDRDGQPRGPRRYVMSRRGNDLVRRYLWLAALSAVQHNRAVRALSGARWPGQ